MNRIRLVPWIVLLSVLITVGAAPAGQNGNGTFIGQQALTAAEAENLAFLREEEKLARDVYLYLYKEWEQLIFVNIAASEQQHMDAVKKLLDKYGMDDPADGKGEGEFINLDLQALYDSLTLDGSASKLDALQAGVIIERMDIDDLQGIIDGTEKLDIIKVCENLMNGSINHLEAFFGEIELMGEIYDAF